mgnify:CR=1 FL=1
MVPDPSWRPQANVASQTKRSSHGNRNGERTLSDSAIMRRTSSRFGSKPIARIATLSSVAILRGTTGQKSSSLQMSARGQSTRTIGINCPGVIGVEKLEGFPNLFQLITR